ncbi:gamma-tubulin complex DGRIP91/SPC98 component [Coprinopsis marcescibilis]|uniref:Gamma-tubulin complex DGRIP91/SPC98 component n=1 Tax=Coprinopsis marcescibilis TaxID=230819 RepID=A0A5C3KS61_COPMA|nr:gamma-tubulin complex DGRIP91/SPC98 component [Coprinopsis marcescibilis]
MTTSLSSLICSLVPAARVNAVLRQDLTAQCQDILSSHIGQSHEVDFNQVVDAIKRKLLRNAPGGTDVLKFTNLLARLLKQHILSRKPEVLSFLTSVAFQEDPSLNPSSLFTRPPSPRRALKSKPATQVKQEPTSRQDTSTGRSKAQILREHRQSKSLHYAPEELLLRDSIYILQGITGKYIQFSSSDEDDDRIVFLEDQVTRYTVSPSTKALVHRLAELGYLYRRVDNFIRERETASGIGMIEQSLCHHLQSQLKEYYRLIAVLETQALSSIPQTGLERSNDNLASETGVSLKRLDVWLNDWRLRMRMMSVCVEGAREAQGGALVNLIHSYTDNGDPFVRNFTHQLLEEVSCPFFATLHKWLFSGDLYDPYGEFFVAVDTTLGPTQVAHPSSLSGGINEISADGGFGAQGGDPDDFAGPPQQGGKLWENKYQLREAMLPNFVGKSSGTKARILSTGKSLNFIRYSCHDSEWVVTREKMSSFRGTLKYSDVNGLEKSIDSAYRLASHRLFEVFIEKFKLLDHLSALKHYLFLGHGDFADQLMDALGPSLAKPANALYRHNLTATLETAIRSSNAQHDTPDVLRRLDARMLEYSHGEIGWDVFTLEYKVDAPIDTVLDALAMEGYLKLFRHLWQMKRVEKTLDRSWSRVISGARTFIRVPELEHEWHKIRISISEMIHFIRQVEAYCRLEVIECSWKVLIDFLNKKEGDLDSIIGAHRTYLDRVVKKIFLWNMKLGKEEVVHNMMKDAFAIVLMYREAMENFYNHCLSEAARRDQAADEQRGVFTGKYEPSASEDVAQTLTTRLHQYGQNFSDKVQSIVQHLQVHPDLDCRFLAIRLSFSDYYKSRKEARS